MKTERVETDVLVIGGGIAGCMAAIHARELGAKVVIVDKGNTLYSGAGRVGNDDIACYIPEVNGPDIETYIKNYALGQAGARFRTTPRAVIYTHYNNSFDIVKLWDEWGIPMKYKGKYEFAGHRFPGRPGPHLKYSGAKQKQVLTEQALKRGANIVNRVMVNELFGDANGVTGALGFDTREDRIIEFAAKSVILGTGRVTRLYVGATPAIIGNDNTPLTLTGDGRAMAYRLGADLFQVESFTTHVGIKNFIRDGQGTWVGVYRYSDGRPIGKYVTKPDRRYGDITPEIDKEIFRNINAQGRGPVWYDCRGISEEDLEYMEWWLFNEGNKALLDHMKGEGIDLRKNPVEFCSYPIRFGGGRIWQNEKAETSIKGLYCAGDESHGGIGGSAVYGWIAGENAAKYAKAAPSPDIDKDKATFENWKSVISTLQSRRYGPDWKDANIALQHTMYDYAGFIRSGPMLETGLAHLRRLRKKVDTTMRAGNRWELTRCLEVMNLYDLGELIFLAALERKESRGMHRRADYPLIDPLLNDETLIVKSVDGKPVLEWKEIDLVLK